MPDLILVLAGAIDSGKTLTIKRMIKDKHLKKERRNMYSYTSKLLCIYISSPQEQHAFCHFQEIIATLRKKFRKCAWLNGDLLIVPFTMTTRRKKGSQYGKLNSDCITEPIGYLRRSMHKRVHLVYLQRHDAHNVTDMNKLMKKMKAQIIVSNKDYSRQAKRLWETVKSIT